MEYKYYKIGKRKLEKMLEETPRDNANLGYNPETVNKYICDEVFKQYALDKMPSKARKLYEEGILHHHDLEYCMTRPNCMNYDIRFFAKNGLKIDGIGDMGSVAKPANNLEVILNHLLQALMAGSICFSGGQGLGNFNTFLAPYCRDRDYYEIKQAIQGFIFNCNMSLVSKGGQIIFSSIGVDLSIPEVLKNEPAISLGGVANGVYGDYEKEFNLLFKAICEVINEKDATGNYHRFPNVLFNIRKGDLDKYEGNCRLLHELGANNPTIYYNNCTRLERTTMGCRTSLAMNYTGKYDEDCLNTGNFMYSTINLPLIALEPEKDFYEYLNNVCESIYEFLHWRRETVRKIIYENKISTFLLWEDVETGKPLYNFDTTSMSIGFCGLYECLKANPSLDGEEILKFLNKKKDEFHSRDGLRWSIFATPAESTSFKFGKIIREKYPEFELNGGARPYLTNSTHIPVNQENTIIDHIQNADKYHKYTGAGNILHIWLGEVWSDPKSLWKLNQKIINTNTIFWAYSKVFSWCKTCGWTINDNIKECQMCGEKEDILVYDRITGYYLPIKTWNDGKLAEFKDRYRQRGLDIE